MKRLLFTMAASCALLLVAVPGVRADEYDKKTDVTTSGPIQVPGAVLPAGQYMFKLVNSSSNRHIVQVSSEDGRQVYAITMTIPARRNKPDDKHNLTFYETPQGRPEAVRTWFWPGELDGQEFVYPRRQAQEIAQLTGGKIPESTDIAVAPPQPAPAPPEATETHVAEAAAAAIPAPAPAAPPEPVELAQNNPPPAAQPQPEPEAPPAAQPATPEPSQDNSELPQTASDLPLIALIGFVALMAAAALRAFTRARA